MKQVYKKIGLVREAIGSVDKDGYNPHHKYNYQSWEDVLGSVRRACSAHGLLILPSTTDIKQEGKKTTLGIRFTLVDIDSGEKVELDWVGESDDAQDKGVNKAGTAGYKYFCLKLFQITTKDDEDPDGAGAVAGPTAPKWTLPTKAPDKVKKACEEYGVPFDKLCEIAQERKIGTATKLNELLKELAEQVA